MIIEFSKYEAVRWYKGGKLGEPIADNIPDYHDWLPDDELRNFLLDNDAYEAYMRNVMDQNPHLKTHLIKEPKREWLNHCFTWDDTPEGDSFWSRLNDEWKNRNFRIVR